MNELDVSKTQSVYVQNQPTGQDENGNPSPWYRLYEDVLQKIFFACRDSNSLKSLLPFRRINHSCNNNIVSLVMRIIKPPARSDAPSAQFFEQNKRCVATYRESHSKTLLNCSLYQHDCNTRYMDNPSDNIVYYDKNEHAAAVRKQEEASLKSLKSTSFYPCLQFTTYSLRLLTNYRYYLETLGLPFQPRKLYLSLVKVPELYCRGDEIGSVAYYAQLKPLLTGDLQSLTLLLMSAMFPVLTDPKVKQHLKQNPE